MLSLLFFCGCAERINEKWITNQAQKYLTGREDIDDAVRQNILAGKITIGMFPDEAVAAGGPFFYRMKTKANTMVSVADIRFFFEYEQTKPSSPRIPPDMLWKQRTEPSTNITFSLTFRNKTQFDTTDFESTRVTFESGRVSSIEKLKKTDDD